MSHATRRTPTVLQVCGVGDGGAAEHVLRLSEGLVARGWEVHLSCPPSWLAREGRALGLRVSARPYSRRPSPLEDLATVAFLFQSMKRHGYDVVHLHSSKAGAVGRLAARLAGRPSVYTPHAWAFLMDSNGPARWLWTTFERAGALLGDAVICVSEAERSAGERAGVLRANRAVVIRNGVAVPDPGRPARIDDRIVVGTVARLSRQKGIDVLLTAIPDVLRAIPHARFVIVGDGPESRRLREQADRLGITDVVDFRTDLTGRARSLLPTFDVFVLPSRWEGMPLALMEACAAGLPCVATDVGGVAEVLDDGLVGQIVRPGDPSALATGLVRVLSSGTLRADLGRSARERMRIDFGLGRMIDETERVYLETALADALRA